MDFSKVIRTIPDYPKKGIMFRDITTLLGNARAFRRAVDEMVQPYAGVRIDKVAGMRRADLFWAARSPINSPFPSFRYARRESFLGRRLAKIMSWNTAPTGLKFTKTL